MVDKQRSIPVDTLSALINQGFSITAYCVANPQVCNHSVALDLPALAAKLGPGFVTVGDPNPLAAKLRCAKCGGRAIQLSLSPNSNVGAGSTGHSLSRSSS